MMMRNLLASLLACGLLASAASAVPVFKITEAYTGLSGGDGTEDWFEVTNFGTMVGDTSTLVYDDVNPTLAGGGILDSFMLAPGESAVFLISSELGSVTTFESIWGSIPRIGLTNGGGNLGQGGDEVNLLDFDGNLVDQLAYTSSGDLATFDRSSGTGNPTSLLSVVGVNGAYESNPFVNDTDTGATVTLVGSPGSAVPEPSTIMLAILGLTTTGVLIRRK